MNKEKLAEAKAVIAKAAATKRMLELRERLINAENILELKKEELKEAEESLTYIENKILKIFQAHFENEGF